MSYPACVGCGYCCKKAPCPLGVLLFDASAPCKGLIFKEGRYWCQPLIKSTGVAKGVVRKRLEGNLSIGAGCCSSLNTDRLTFLSNSSSPSSAP